jgi:hypothetical protein
VLPQVVDAIARSSAPSTPILAGLTGGVLRPHHKAILSAPALRACRSMIFASVLLACPLGTGDYI